MKTSRTPIAATPASAATMIVPRRVESSFRDPSPVPGSLDAIWPVSAISWVLLRLWFLFGLCLLFGHHRHAGAELRWIAGRIARGAVVDGFEVTNEVPDHRLVRGWVVTRAGLVRVVPPGDVELREPGHRQGPAARAAEGAKGCEEEIDSPRVAGEIRKVLVPVVRGDALVRARVPVDAQVHSLGDLAGLVTGLERNAIPGLRQGPQRLVRRGT